jgi:capsular polysaccharide biosynthesis protein
MTAPPQTMRPPAKRLSMLGIARRGWVVPLVVVAVAAIAFGVNRIRTHQVTAQSVVLVTSEAGPDGPGFATEAAKLALSYATVIPQDQSVVQQIGSTIGRSSSYVRDHFSVSNPTDTAILQLRFRDKSPSLAAEGSRAAVQAVAGDHPVTPAIGAGSIQAVRLADRPKRPAKGDVIAVIIGAVLGLAFGIVLLLAWERADRRIDDPKDVLAHAGLPATRLESLSPQAVGSLLERWARLSESQPTRVAIVPLTSGMAAIAREVAYRLQGAAPAHVQRYGEGGGGGYEPVSGMTIVATAPLGSDGTAEGEALRSDVRVLFARRGLREREIDSALTVLHQFGAPADWLLLSGSPKRVQAWLAQGPAPEPERPGEPAPRA